VHGKVCPSIFDKNWTPDTGIMTVLQCVYGLLLTPDTTDPLDSTLALAFYDDSGKYEADILMHVKAHANKTRQQLADSM
jgi:ubiquitin-protein ligase